MSDKARKGKPNLPFAPWATKKLEHLELSVRNAEPKMVKENIFTDSDWEFFDDADEAYKKYNGSAGMWATIHGITRVMALIELGYMTSLIEYQTFLRLLGEVRRHKGFEIVSGRVTHHDPALESDREPAMIVREEVLRRRLVVAATGDFLDVYWQGDRIATQVKRSDSTWRLLELLARSRNGVPRIGAEWIRTHNIDMRLKDAKHRLKAKLPDALFDAIIGGEKTGFRFDLEKIPPDDIRFIGDERFDIHQSARSDGS